MKKLFQKILNWILNLLFSLFHLFTSTKNKEKEMTKQQLEKLQKTNESSYKKEEETDTTPNGSRNLFKEHLQLEQIKALSKEELEEEIYKIIEKIYKIKRDDLSSIQKENLKKYIEKMIKNLEEEITKKKLIQKEEIQKVMEEKVKKDFQEKKEIYFVIEEIPQEKKEKSEQNYNNSFQKEIYQSPNQIKDQQQKSETLLNEEFKTNKVVDNFDHLSTEAIVHLDQTNEVISIKEQAEDHLPFLFMEEIPTIEEKKLQEERKFPEKNSKEETIPENKPENKKQQVSLNKKESLPIITINLSELELENNILIENARKEYTKEDLIDKEYEKIEALLNEKIQNLENLLQKNTSQEQKEKIQKELAKIQDVKEKVLLHQEQDLEELRVSLEESIPQDEKQLQELTEDKKLEKKKQEFLQLKQKTSQEIEEYKKRKIKEELKKTLHRLEIPLFLSFPFIKNKYFRRFVKGLFIFRSFFFLKNLIFKSKFEEDIIDLSTIKRGSDALEESIAITEKNKLLFDNLKISIIQKYPDLLNDLQFTNTLNELELKLNEEYEKLLKQEKVVNKYFDKSQILIRKRKR